MNKSVKITNERNFGRFTTFNVEGFDTKEEANEWLHEWKLRNFGYTPLGVIEKKKDSEEYYIFAEIWHSCD